MIRFLTLALITLAAGVSAPATAPADASRNAMRAPAYPLVTIDPYTNVWSMADHLYDDDVRHWTEVAFPLRGWLTVDGVEYRFMGAGEGTAAVQLYADAQATRTHYGFTCGPVELSLTFTAPLLLDNPELISRPVNYISYGVKATDGKKHVVAIRFEASPLWAVNTPEQETVSEKSESGKLVLLRAGTKEQNHFSRKGDDVRIDWGYFYLAADKKNTAAEVLPDGMLGISRNLGSRRTAAGFIMIGYDDVYSIRYFGEKLRPYWNRSGNRTIADEFAVARKDYKRLMKRCDKFDRELIADATAAGGRKYAELCALSYRQSICAQKLVQAPDGKLLLLSKENNSNGSIGTVDISYPAAPLYLKYNPKMSEAMINANYYYSESGRWTKPFPAHDVGTYPMAEGQTYPGDMPVEEAGNMIILTAAICHFEKSGDYAAKHWETLSIWAEYLRTFGLDPENQLCTDDFAGHFAHNANLSIKAIVALACYGRMAQTLGKADIDSEYTAAAREMASQWIQMASDGDHYRLTFDKPGTWSQKYNMVWDKILDLGLFPKEVRATETAWYLNHQNAYGLPLDNREMYTKSDWIVWTATLADNPEDFEALISPMWRFYNETRDRVPMSDWYFTHAPHRRGFKARAVVGGHFIKLL
ncbi:MAG: DUF4965 domain-containing protein [Bacteroidales bacterium]|nr:DUF4965 domain-containing protein [Bacteroidales bacterium]